MPDQREWQACVAMLDTWRDSKICEAAKQIFEVFDRQTVWESIHRAMRDHIRSISTGAAFADGIELMLAFSDPKYDHAAIEPDVEITMGYIMKMPTGIKTRTLDNLNLIDERFGPRIATINAEYDRQIQLLGTAWQARRR